MRKRYTFTLDPEVVEGVKKSLSGRSLSRHIEDLLRGPAAIPGVVRGSELRAKGPGKLRMGSPEEIAKQLADDVDLCCLGCDLPMADCECV